MIFWILIIGALFFVIHIIRKKFKTPKCDSMVCVTGGVKSGKSTFSFHVAYKTYRRNLRSVKIRNFIAKIFNKEQSEIPLFYTTIPVAVPHVLLTKDLLLRNMRFNFKSVIWVDEASILADSMEYKDLDVNERLLLFNKLIAHETHGGTIVYNTQSITDLHYSIKRCVSELFYVHSTYKWIPFFLIVTVREERYSEDGLAINTYNEDVEDSLKRVIVRKSVWKKFDCYAYSSMTDDKPVYDNVQNAESLKAQYICSFNPRRHGAINENNDDKGGIIDLSEKENS